MSIKIKTDQKNRFGNSIQTSAGVIAFDKEGYSEVSEDVASKLVTDGYTDPYVVDSDFTPVVEDEVELTPELVGKLKKEELIATLKQLEIPESDFIELKVPELRALLLKTAFPDQQ